MTVVIGMQYNSGMPNDTRERMVAGAARAISRSGVDAMSLRVLADAEGVPLGSIYHFFPGGKAALVDEAVNHVGDRVTANIAATRGKGSEHIVRWVLHAWRRILVKSDFRAGCPVLAAAMAKDERHRHAAQAVFDRWTAQLAEVLVGDGVPEDRAPALARTMIAALEGAVGLARAFGTIEPLDDVETELTRMVAGAAGTGVTPAGAAIPLR
jgi:TetR/AcrR family transcriptional repressor of lmrAB and yxaGH operons